MMLSLATKSTALHGMNQSSIAGAFCSVRQHAILAQDLSSCPYQSVYSVRLYNNYSELVDLIVDHVVDLRVKGGIHTLLGGKSIDSCEIHDISQMLH